MSVPWGVLTALVPILDRHLKAYVDTAAQDAAIWAKDLRRRLLAAALAMAGALMCVILASAWVVGAAWNTPWRNPVLAALLGVFLLCVITGATLAARRFKPGQEPFARLRSELGTDQSLLGNLCGPERLQRTRREGLALFGQGATEPGPNATFPRSVVVRMLLKFTGLSRAFR